MNSAYDIDLQGKKLHVELSKAALNELQRASQSLHAEMELYFSCLIRKQVRFGLAAAQGSNVKVNDKLSISFHPVMTKVCGKDYEGDEPPLTDFPIQREAAFVPRWLKIDYRAGDWSGEFGYD